MSKLIICCAGRPALNGHKRRTFLWSTEHNCFIHEGRELTETELNAQVEGVCKKNWDLRPYVKVVRFSDGSGPAAAPVEDGSKAKIADLQEKLAIARADAHTARHANDERLLELTAKIASLEAEAAKPRTVPAVDLDQALEIVTRLAPEKLKGKPGRKAAPEVMEA